MNKAIVLGLCLVLVLFLISSGWAQEGGTEYLLSSRIAPGSDVDYVRKIEQGMFSLNKNASFVLQARITPKVQEQEVLFEQTEISMPLTAQKCLQPPCSWSWEQDLEGKDISIMDRPKLELSWEQDLEENTPQVRVQAVFSAQNASGRNMTRTVEGVFSGDMDQRFEEVQHVNMQQAEFTEKSKWYLARLALGLKPGDDKWRYSFSDAEDLLVMQTRADIAARKANALRIVCTKGQEPKRINYSIDKDGDGDKDTNLHMTSEQGDRKFRNGVTVLTLNIDRAMRRKGLDPDQAVILEPILKFDLSFSRFSKIKPLHSISWGRWGAGQRQIQCDVRKKQGTVSLVWDFAEHLEQEGLWDAKYKSLRLEVKSDGPQILEWQKARLFSSFKDQVPVILFEPQKSLAQWGLDKTYAPRFKHLASFEPVLFSLQEKEKKAGQQVLDMHYQSLQAAPVNVDGSNRLLLETVPIGKKKQRPELWNKNNFYIQDKLGYIVQGLDKAVLDFVLAGNGTTGRKSLRLDSGQGVIETFAPGTQIVQCRLKDWSWTKSERRDFKLALFNLEYTGDNALSSLGSWREREAGLYLRPPEDSSYQVENESEVYLYAGQNGQGTWELTLPEAEYLLARELQLPRLDGQCEYILKRNGKRQRVSTASAGRTLKGLDLQAAGNSLQIRCAGQKQLYKMSLPVLRVKGLKQSSTGYLQDIGLQIGGRDFRLGREDLGLIEKADWIDLGTAELDQGEYMCNVRENSFFSVQSVLLKTSEKIFDLDELGQSSSASSGIMAKLVRLGVKLLVLLVLIGLVYWFRRPVKKVLSSVWQACYARFCAAYTFLPDEVWVVLWAMASCALYALSVMSSAKGGGNAASFAGICFVLFYWHMMQLLRNMIERRFPGLGSHIYYSSSKVFFAGAILFLVLTAILVAINLEPIAEQVAVVVYYCLVVGVVGELVNLRKEKEDKVEA